MIENDEAHAAALAAIERLWGSDPKTAAGEELDQLLSAVAEYEERRWPEANGA
jgi:HTH-type transcriptional regulator/antitoxin HigA